MGTFTDATWLTGGHDAARARLLCFPYAGGGTAAFRGWPAMLAGGIELCRVRLPGREGRLREPMPARFDELADRLADALRPACDRPYAFFGHSLGALLGFEVARRLRDSLGTEPLALFAAAHPAPHMAPPDGESSGASGPMLPDLPGKRARELMALTRPVLDADRAVRRSYRYRPGEPFGCRIVVFGASENPEISEEELGAWRKHTTAECTVTMVPGGHFFLYPARDQLLATIGDVLGRAVAGASAKGMSAC